MMHTMQTKVVAMPNTKNRFHVCVRHFGVVYNGLRFDSWKICWLQDATNGLSYQVEWQENK